MCSHEVTARRFVSSFVAALWRVLPGGVPSAVIGEGISRDVDDSDGIVVVPPSKDTEVR